MEVLTFLAGDPDKPLVAGCVNYGRNDASNEPPKHKMRSTFKTGTHQGDGFNELRFEDENGEEEIENRRIPVGEIEQSDWVSIGHRVLGKAG